MEPHGLAQSTCNQRSPNSAHFRNQVEYLRLSEFSTMQSPDPARIQPEFSPNSEPEFSPNLEPGLNPNSARIQHNPRKQHTSDIPTPVRGEFNVFRSTKMQCPEEEGAESDREGQRKSQRVWEREPGRERVGGFEERASERQSVMEVEEWERASDRVRGRRGRGRTFCRRP
jgi:hypothetical protein